MFQVLLLGDALALLRRRSALLTPSLLHYRPCRLLRRSSSQLLNVKEKGEAQPLLLAPRFKVPAQALTFLKKTAMRLHKQAWAADILGSALRLLGSAERGIAMVDEVDLLLHPLKSELNYPVGDDKVPLHLAQDNLRWYAAMHMFEPLFHDGGALCRKRYCMPDAPPNTARDTLKARIWVRFYYRYILNEFC